ncbi:MAG: YiiX/YebB-like N1pC/P60 family cysteine hydrolase [Chitinophagaceae bacterium]|nr:YiiX/YebB-like N1pC/P60 family cysteine hydrolase [Chitinophagaceae bacterium]
MPADIIFRNGTDEISRAARAFNRKDTSFSHCGIVFRENDTFFVYHIIGGQYNPSGKLMKEPLNRFCNPQEFDRIGLCRFPLSITMSQQLHEHVKQMYTAGLRFDPFFNIRSDDKMYCSEFVFKTLNTVMNGKLRENHPIAHNGWVSVDDILLHPMAKIILHEKLY